VAVAGQLTRDRQCAACVLGSSFQPDRNQEECRAATVCPPGKFVLVNASVSSDRACSLCAAGSNYTALENEFACRRVRQCSSNELESRAPNATHNRECSKAPASAAAVAGPAVGAAGAVLLVLLILAVLVYRRRAGKKVEASVFMVPNTVPMSPGLANGGGLSFADYSFDNPAFAVPMEYETVGSQRGSYRMPQAGAGFESRLPRGLFCGPAPAPAVPGRGL
jgi:hypothetical protein